MARRKTYLQWTLIILVFLWMAFVYASFYLVQQQRPLDATHVRAVGSTLLDLAAAGCILVVAALAGSQVCQWLGVQFDHPAELLVWGTGIGLGILGIVMLGLGLLGGLTRWAVALLLVIVAAASLSRVTDLFQAVLRLRATARPGRALGVYLCAMLILTLLVALAPPFGWDALFYHLTFPRLYMEQGRIAPITDVPHQYFPGLMETLYLAAMLLKGDTAAKLLHFAYLVLLGGGVYLLARRHLRPTAGWPAVALYAATPMVFALGGWAYNDLALAFSQIAALYALLQWMGDGNWRWLALSAAFCGLALGVKYTAFMCPLTVGLVVLWRLGRMSAPAGQWRRALLLLGASTAAVAAPWYLRNLAMTGNPVYPFAYGLFGGRDWDAWRAAWYARPGTGLGWDLGALVRLPWTLTLGIEDMNFWDGRTGPLYLLLLPFLIAWGVRAFGRRPRGAGVLLVFALIQLGFWTAGVIGTRGLFQSRLLLPGLVVLCAPLACVIEDLRVLDTRHFSIRRLVVMSIVLVLGANLVYQFYYTLRIRPLPVLVGEESRGEFARRNLGAYYQAMEAINSRVPGDGRVLFFWEPRSYYAVRDVQPDPILERWAWMRYRFGDDLDALADFLRQEGYTHLLLHREGLARARQIGFDPIDAADVAALEDLLRRYAEPAAEIGTAYTLFRLVYE